MSHVMRQLRTDHSQVARLLGLLTRQLDLVKVAGSADFEIMEDAMKYMTGYADRYHHPREDLVFARLRERDAGIGEVLDSLGREHRALGAKGEAFQKVLEGVVDGAMVEREGFEAQGRDYVEFLRSHMVREDNEVFPRADSALTDADWRHVEETLGEREDPLFGRVVQEDFSNLYDYIMREAG